MLESNWKQKKKHTLELLRRLLRIYYRELAYDEIKIVGPDANQAVLDLGRGNVSLPLPYDEEKMGPSSMRVISDYLDFG